MLPILFVTCSIHGLDNSPITVTKTDTTYHHTIRETPNAMCYRDVRILSKYNLSQERVTLCAMVDSQTSEIDLRPLETHIIKNYCQSQPFHIKHRGKLGFMTAMGIISIPMLYTMMNFPRFTK